MLNIRGITKRIAELEYLIEWFNSIGFQAKELESFLERLGASGEAEDSLEGGDEY